VQKSQTVGSAQTGKTAGGIVQLSEILDAEMAGTQGTMQNPLQIDKVKHILRVEKKVT
jgi:hypothetical protein